MKFTLRTRGETFDLMFPSGISLLEFLQSQEIPVNAACGGKGTCTKCRCKVEKGFLPISVADRKAFNESELASGWRLSCQARPRTSLSAFLPGSENLRLKPRVVEFVDLSSVAPASARLVCDLGSTGVVIAVIDGSSGELLVESHLLNKQIPFGADVMTRLESAQRKGTEPLRKALFDTFRICLKSLDEAFKGSLADRLIDKKLFVSGNSVMTSFLAELSIEHLAVAPFQPASTGENRFEWEGYEIITLPLLGGFVGGDTFAGIAALMDRKVPTPWMLVDIGTNTEIVSFDGEKMFFSSAPAGPAFEGGNITHGMRAEIGAISQATYSRESGWNLTTIGDDVAKGICGSGLMDVLAQAVAGGVITEDGYVPDGQVRLTEDIFLTADDVREFQLAKSATRTAIDLMMDRAGVPPNKIYLAGTFAQHLDLKSVRAIGLLPSDIESEAIGNASLSGVILRATRPEAEIERLKSEIDSKKIAIELALQDDFQDRFVRNLNFPKDAP